MFCWSNQQSFAAERKSNLTNIVFVTEAGSQHRLIKDGGRATEAGFFFSFFFLTGNFPLALTLTLTLTLTSTLSNTTDKEHIFHVFNHCRWRYGHWLCCQAWLQYILANPQVPANTATAAPQPPTVMAAREIEVQPPCDHSRRHPA